MANCNTRIAKYRNIKGNPRALNAVEEVGWSRTLKQEGSHVQIHGFELVSIYGNVIRGTACYCIIVWGRSRTYYYILLLLYIIIIIYYYSLLFILNTVEYATIATLTIMWNTIKYQFWRPKMQFR